MTASAVQWPVAIDLEVWGPLSLMSIIQELLGRVVAPVYKTEIMAVEMRHPSIC
jgi:hypothetical protein